MTIRPEDADKVENDLSKHLGDLRIYPPRSCDSFEYKAALLARVYQGQG